jgi:hypothetical protein
MTTSRLTPIAFCLPSGLSTEIVIGLRAFLGQLESEGHSVFVVGKNLPQDFDRYWIPYYAPVYSGQCSTGPGFEKLDVDQRNKWIVRVEARGAKRHRVTSGADYVARAEFGAGHIFRIVGPDGLYLIWNQFDPQFGIIYDLGRKNNYRVGVIERGLLPGTIQIDVGGFGPLASYVQTDLEALGDPSEHARYQRIGEELMRRRESVVEVLYGGRSVGHHLRWKIEGARRRGKRIVLCYGAGDTHCGQYPGGSPESKTLMAMFSSGPAIAKEIAKDAKNFVLYKSHPKSGFAVSGEDLQVNLLNVDACPYELAKISDAVVAWGTKIELIPFLLQKPLVLVGVGCLWGKGVAFEVRDPQVLLGEIEKACMTGISDEMLKRFNVFLGWLLSAELFDFRSTPNGEMLEAWAHRLRCMFHVQTIAPAGDLDCSGTRLCDQAQMRMQMQMQLEMWGRYLRFVEKKHDMPTSLGMLRRLKALGRRLLAGGASQGR